jgi:hypothetical protein
MTGRVAIFYSPHQDDEALAMAGAILDHRRQGAKVVLVLLSNGRPSPTMVGAVRSKYGASWWTEQIMGARRAEFIASTYQLGVDEVFYGAPGRLVDDQPNNPASPRQWLYLSKVATVKAIIQYFNTQYSTQVLNPFHLGKPDHRIISGLFEQNNGIKHDLHVASVRAAKELVDTRGFDPDQFLCYRVYEHVKPNPADRGTGCFEVVELSDADNAVKQTALDQYTFANPAFGRIGFGQISVGNLISSVRNDPREFVDKLPPERFDKILY